MSIKGALFPLCKTDFSSELVAQLSRFINYHARSSEFTVARQREGVKINSLRFFRPNGLEVKEIEFQLLGPKFILTKYPSDLAGVIARGEYSYFDVE